jgi:hypothetical protein
VRNGSLPAVTGSIIRLFHSDLLGSRHRAGIVAGSAVVDGGDGLVKAGERYRSRQTVALGGGSNEMARNAIGEHVPGFPPEYSADRGIAFNQVKHNRSGSPYGRATAGRHRA